LVVDGDGVAVGIGEGEHSPERPVGGWDDDGHPGGSEFVVQRLSVVGVQPQRDASSGPGMDGVQLEAG